MSYNIIQNSKWNGFQRFCSWALLYYHMFIFVLKFSSLSYRPNEKVENLETLSATWLISFSEVTFCNKITKKLNLGVRIIMKIMNKFKNNIYFIRKFCSFRQLHKVRLQLVEHIMQAIALYLNFYANGIFDIV